jgi:hypothetical protein
LIRSDLIRISTERNEKPFTSEISGKTISPSLPGRTGPAEKTPNIPVRTSFLNLAAALGLPGDRLSASILSFLRFFSLPLDSAAQIRSRALDSADPKSPDLKGPEIAAEKDSGQAGSTVLRGAETLLRSREALSLAGAAFLDKGLQPGGEALEKYAGAIDPDRRRSPGNSAGNGGEAHHGKGGDSDSSEDRDGSGVPDGELLRRRTASGDPLLDLVNRLPGRSGKRWIVIPFEWEQYRVTLRILLGSGDVRPYPADRMAMEIVSEAEHWLFIFNFHNSIELSFGRQPSPGQRIFKLMKKELSALLDIPFEQIHPQNWEKFPPFAPESRDEALLSINEEV